jgi:hypothetical protein
MLPLSLFTGALILAVTGIAASAQFEYEKKIEFRPGGQTIAGPGIAVVQRGNTTVLMDTQATADQGALCATVANVGPASLRVAIGAFNRAVAPFETTTLCRPEAGFVILQCEDASTPDRTLPCQALWRIDEWHPLAR